eukprot:1950-Pelagococcus_subviridis.AAC.1
MSTAMMDARTPPRSGTNHLLPTDASEEAFRRHSSLNEDAKRAPVQRRDERRFARPLLLFSRAPRPAGAREPATRLVGRPSQQRRVDAFAAASLLEIVGYVPPRRAAAAVVVVVVVPGPPPRAGPEEAPRSRRRQQRRSAR